MEISCSFGSGVPSAQVVEAFAILTTLLWDEVSGLKVDKKIKQEIKKNTLFEGRLVPSGKAAESANTFLSCTDK